MTAMKEQAWIFSVRYWPHVFPVERWAVVGPACASTVEAALHLANAPEDVRTEIRSHTVVRLFIDGQVDPKLTGYSVQSDPHSNHDAASWLVCIGPVLEVLMDRGSG